MYTISTLIPSVYSIEGQKHSWYRRMSPGTAFLRKNPFSGQVRVENKKNYAAFPDDSVCQNSTGKGA